MMPSDKIYMSDRFFAAILVVLSVALLNIFIESLSNSRWMGWITGCPLAVSLLCFFAQWMRLCGVTSLDPRRRAHFDELNVLQTFHPRGKDYGHMNIDEPPTPFENILIGDDPDASPIPVSAGLLFSKLAQVQDEEQKQTEKEKEKRTSLEPSVDFSEAQRKETLSKAEQFEQKRAAHYDEGRMLQYAHQLAMASLAEDLDEDTTENRDETDFSQMITEQTQHDEEETLQPLHPDQDTVKDSMESNEKDEEKATTPSLDTDSTQAVTDFSGSFSP